MSEYTHYWATKLTIPIEKIQNNFREKKVYSIIGCECMEEHKNRKDLNYKTPQWTVFTVDGLESKHVTIENYDGMVLKFLKNAFDVFVELFVEENRRDWSIMLYFKKVFIVLRLYEGEKESLTTKEKVLFEQCFDDIRIIEYLKPGFVTQFCMLAGIPYLDMLTPIYLNLANNPQEIGFFKKRGYSILGKDFRMKDWENS